VTAELGNSKPAERVWRSPALTHAEVARGYQATFRMPFPAIFERATVSNGTTFR
jgi:hypothetical protein